MITFIKAKLRQSDDQTNIDIYWVVTNIKESSLKKFMLIRQLFHVKMYVIMSKIMFKMDVITFWLQL